MLLLEVDRMEICLRPRVKNRDEEGDADKVGRNRRKGDCIAKPVNG